MSSAAILMCRQLLFSRCIHAGLLSVGVQLVMLITLLLCVNFQLWHPLDWAADSLRQVCSCYPWLASMPLIVAVAFYVITLSKQRLSERRYCPTRYRWLIHHGPRKLLFLIAHVFVGYLTAWLYTTYLHTDYRHLVYKSFGQDCLNSYHVFLLGMGITSGCYYFAANYMRQEVAMEFPIIEQKRIENLRGVLYETLLKSPLKSLWVTLVYSIGFWLFGGLVRHRLTHLIGVDADDRLLGILDVASNGRLLFYAWLLTTQIVSNMHLMQRFNHVLLSERLPLVIARSRMSANASEQELTVASVLGLFDMYVAQCLAARFLYEHALCNNSTIRLEIFQLTEPGNHPANWRALCDQCLSIVATFTEELIESMQHISLIKGNESHLATTAAFIDKKGPLRTEKLLIRQYNQLHGIRPASAEPTQQWDATDSVRHVPNRCERAFIKLETMFLGLLPRLPGIVYLFAESDGAKTVFLVDNALHVIWLTQALAHLCVASIKQDRYGVVQDDLTAIIRALHRLKCELDKLHSALPSLRPSHSSNYIVLRGAIRRSLYNICISFHDYLGEVIPNGEELRQLQAFICHG
ncbi:nucleoporin Ndc1 [Drosophila grimshawi]|uniref:GH13245 n=1 Tax=Drosophila grimshawi TaxID=7222 RepID=B4JTZ6_DROGR|nr:nucleoporin Ndc1 [Drosophila grimshawi]EDV91575.1 GH13245 [Drosophila grimshawi]